jgi:hypothetical protein
MPTPINILPLKECKKRIEIALKSIERTPNPMHVKQILKDNMKYYTCQKYWAKHAGLIHIFTYSNYKAACEKFKIYMDLYQLNENSTKGQLLTQDSVKNSEINLETRARKAFESLPAQESIDNLIQQLGEHPIYLIYFKSGELTGGSSLDDKKFIRPKAKENQKYFSDNEAVILMQNPEGTYELEYLPLFLKRTGLEIISNQR